MGKAFPYHKLKHNTPYNFISKLRISLKERVMRLFAHKLGNPRLQRITFHTFRHWKATMLAHQTKDPFFVMNYLGHKNIMNTMHYVHLSQLIFEQEKEEYICKVARTIDEAAELIEVGFEHVCEIEGARLFRKRK
ncbi:site-specific integrase [Candidatus Bathyarchaeota archaeon]|nr:MAG: site-specific integrase [Candidatus Bathyarchaeota archaeon]